MFELGEAVGALEVAAKSDPADLDDDSLMAAIEVAGVARRLLDATEGHLLAELDRRGTTDVRVGSSTATWVSRTQGISVGTARARVKVGRALTERFDELDAALLDGRMSWEQAKVVVDATNSRNADALAGCQRELIGLAASATFDSYRGDVGGLARLADPDGAERGDDPFASRVHVSGVLDGTVALSGTLAGDLAVTVPEAIDARADELFHRYRAERDADPDAEMPTRATLRALALADLCRAATAVPPESPGTTAPVPEVRLVVPAGDPLTPATDLEGVRLADGTARLLTCDPTIRPLVVDSLGRPLDVGRARRLVTDDLRAAMIHRDGGCIFPGCDSRVDWLEGHHRTHWRDGGATDLDNLEALCRRHHRVIHRPGWHLRPHPDDGWPVIETPAGDLMWAQRHRRTPTGRPPPG